jgi:hypothetical protein
MTMKGLQVSNNYNKEMRAQVGHVEMGIRAQHVLFTS